MGRRSTSGMSKKVSMIYVGASVDVNMSASRAVDVSGDHGIVGTLPLSPTPHMREWTGCSRMISSKFLKEKANETRHSSNGPPLCFVEH